MSPRWVCCCGCFSFLERQKMCCKIAGHCSALGGHAVLAACSERCFQTPHKSAATSCAPCRLHRPSSPMTSSAAFELGLEAARGGSVSRSATAPRASGGLDPSAAALAALQCQLEEKDRLIAELREEVRQLRLSAAETRDVQAHDPGLAKTQQTY